MEWNAIDLFAGCGGLSLGLSNAGFNIVLANEINQDAANTYEVNLIHKAGHDTQMIVDDATNIQVDEILAATNGKKIHLIAAGPPCQGFSMAGLRNINDPRNKLFKQLLRIVKAVDPPLFLMENVKGILTMDDGKVIAEIKSQFEKAGYSVNIKVMKAVEFGVPQIRERVFIIGSKLSDEIIHPVSEQAKPISAREALSDLDFLNAGESSTTYKTQATTKYQQKMRKGSRELFNHEAASHSSEVINRFSLVRPGGNGKDLPEEARTKKMVLHRLHPDKPSRTVVTLPDDYIHYSKDRILTVREMARLQSFPDWFKFIGPKSTGGPRRKFDVPQYSQVGNAVPPLLAEAVGKKLVEHLEKHLSQTIKVRV